eukprot:6481136-Amphidinium_carterae.1
MSFVAVLFSSLAKGLLEWVLGEPLECSSCAITSFCCRGSVKRENGNIGCSGALLHGCRLSKRLLGLDTLLEDSSNFKRK